MDQPQRARLALRIRAEMGRRGITQVKLASMSGYDDRTIRNVLRGAQVKETTLYAICKALGLDVDAILADSAAEATGGAAPLRLGGYTRDAVRPYLGTYLTIRPAFRQSGQIWSYVTSLSWDNEARCMVFEESNRPDPLFSHRGEVYVPTPSSHIFLISLSKGWPRSAVVSQLSPRGRMRGLISTLYNVKGASFIPVSTTIVYVKRDTIDPTDCGVIGQGSKHYDTYARMLSETISDSYATLLSPPCLSGS